ncbi:hypothetical protein [Homoserinimonas hongtaonis]|nr:hypothetical protein [Salinibacterium hongtaonis]
MNSNQLEQIKANFTSALSKLSDEQLLALSTDAYVAVRESNLALVCA